MGPRRENAGEAGSIWRQDRLLPSWRWVFVLLFVWLVPAVVFTTRSALAQPDGSLVLWGRTLVRGLWYWLYWAAICPWIYRMYVRWPLGRRGFWRSALAHALGGIAAALGIALLSAAVRIWALQPPQPAGAVLAQELVSRSAVALHGLHFAKYWFVLGVMALVREIRLRRATELRMAAMNLEASRLEGQLTSATLRALRAQLHPHFLFNALNSVSSLVEKGDGEGASRMIGVLAGLLRATLEPHGEQRIPLARELDLVQRYLALEGLRYGDRLRVALDVPADCQEVQVPSLILQPVVENVVRHAVGRRLEPVALELKGRLGDGRLTITVDDDGPGLPAGWTFATGAGVGLSTTAERLRLVYGDDQRFEVGPSPLGGVRCRLEVPAAVEATVGEDGDA